MAEANKTASETSNGAESVLGKRKSCSDAPQELLTKILNQVEFYFSDSNLPRDKFLKAATEKNDGWVPIQTIASFKRMQQLTTDLSVVTEALRQSESLLTVDEGGKNVRRVKPLPTEEELAKQKLCTVFYKHYPIESSTLDSIKEFFSKFGNVKAVRMMRKDKVFTGCGFVEFSTEKEVADLVASPPKFKEEDEKPVKILKQAEWVESRNKRREKKKSGDAADEGADAESKDNEAAASGTQEEGGFTKNLVFELSMLPSECSFIDVKKVVGPCLFSNAAHGGKNYFYVGLTEGGAAKKAKTASSDESKDESKDSVMEAEKSESDKSDKSEAPDSTEADQTFVTATVRLYEASNMSATDALEKLQAAEVTICGVKPEMRVLTGDEEAENWKQYFAQKKERESHGGGRRGGRGGRRGGRGRGFKRRR